MTSGPIRTLVIHTGAIGDFLLCGPSIAALHREGPVELAGNTGRLRLALLGGWADAVHDLRATGFESLFTTPSQAWREFSGQFDRAVVWMRDDDGAIRRGCAKAGIKRTFVSPGLPPQDWTRHASAYYLSALGMSTETEAVISIKASKSGEILIHPGSGGTRKNWPMDRFTRLAGLLASGGHPVVWLAGPAESELAYPAGATIVRESTLESLAHRLAGARVYIGNDSGITHLAAAVRCPTVAIFGPTDSSVWAPRGSHVRVVQGDPWPTVADVYPAVGLT